MNKYFLIIFLPLFLISCGAADGFKLKKKSSADEFLVEKKSPLVLPPDYGKLPTPIIDQTNEIQSGEEKENEIKKLLTNKENISTEKNQSQSTSLEETILEKIK